MAKETGTKSKKSTTTKKRKRLVHIDDFIQEYMVANNKELSKVQIAGFKAKMEGNHYQPSLKDFVPHIESYLN